RGEGGTVVELVLEGGGEVDLDGIGLGEFAEGCLGEGGSAVLDGAAETVLLAAGFRKGGEGAEVDADVGDGAVGKDDAAVAGTGLDADLADAGERAPSRGSATLQIRHVSAHEAVEVLDGTVASADFADFGADRDGDAGRFDLADVLRELGGV